MAIEISDGLFNLKDSSMCLRHTTQNESKGRGPAYYLYLAHVCHSHSALKHNENLIECHFTGMALMQPPQKLIKTSFLNWV